MAKKAKISNYLETFSPMIAIPFYWLDTNNVFLGVNEAFLTLTGLQEFSQIIGKNLLDIYPEEFAKQIINQDKELLSTGQSYTQVEFIENATTGIIEYIKSVRSPLYDEDGAIVGVMVLAVDITEEKELEQFHHENILRLEAENKTQKILLEQQKKFKNIAAQVAHDLGSPLTSMQMIIKTCTNLPENNRKALQKSAIRISDIAENLLNQFKPKNTENPSDIVYVPTLISAEILEVLTEKKYEYKHTSLDFISIFSQAGYFAFINVDPRSFKSILSNLISNAAYIYDDKVGEITTNLDVIDNNVQITIHDTFRDVAIPAESKLTITSVKEDGYNVGFDQIRNNVANNGGLLKIESVTGIGTKVILTFPRIDPEPWIADKIALHNNSLIVILDDDESIHGAWETRFEIVAPHLQRSHFQHGEEAIKYINSLSAIQKDRLLLLTDYELLRQNLQGLDVISQTGIKNSILVTNHHNNKEVRDLAKLTNTRILPKPLAAEISIEIHETSTEDGSTPKKVNLVFIYEDKEFIGLFKRLMVKNDKIVDAYPTVDDAFSNITQYPKDTNILMGNRFSEGNITGFEIASKLHEMGFKNLYLLSGRDYTGDSSIPPYLTPILKTNIKAVVQLLHT